MEEQKAELTSHNVHQFPVDLSKQVSCEERLLDVLLDIQRVLQRIEQQKADVTLQNVSQLPVDPMKQMCSGERLLEVLFEAQSRPSLRWLRDKTAKRVITGIVPGKDGLVFYIPELVKQELVERWSVRRK